MLPYCYKTTYKTDACTDAAKSRELLQRITTLMQQERLYLAPELKVSDVAARLQLPPRRISECLSQNGAGTFATFINTLFDFLNITKNRYLILIC